MRTHGCSPSRKASAVNNSWMQVQQGELVLTRVYYLQWKAGHAANRVQRTGKIVPLHEKCSLRSWTSSAKCVCIVRVHRPHGMPGGEAVVIKQKQCWREALEIFLMTIHPLCPQWHYSNPFGVQKCNSPTSPLQILDKIRPGRNLGLYLSNIHQASAADC